MAVSSVFGLCGAQLAALDCDGAPDPTVEDVVLCNLVDVTVTPVLSDGQTVQESSGNPGVDCLFIEVDPIVRYYDLVLTTCSVQDPRVDALLGNSDLMIDPATNEPIGSRGLKATTQACLCSCGEEDCQRKTGLILWSLNLCATTDGSKQFAPGGKNMITAFPCITWRPTTNPIISLSANTQGKQYSGRIAPNPAFGQGPGALIPASEIPLNCPWYQFPSDECAPGGCGCGLCGEEQPPPLEF